MVLQSPVEGLVQEHEDDGDQHSTSLQVRNLEVKNSCLRAWDWLWAVGFRV